MFWDCRKLQHTSGPRGDGSLQSMELCFRGRASTVLFSWSLAFLRLRAEFPVVNSTSRSPRATSTPFCHEHAWTHFYFYALRSFVPRRSALCRAVALFSSSDPIRCVQAMSWKAARCSVPPWPRISSMCSSWSVSAHLLGPS